MSDECHISLVPITLCILVAEFDLSVDIRCALAHLWIKFGLREPVQSIHILILLVLRESLEYPASVGFFNPFDFHLLKSPATHDLVYSVHHSHSCAIFKLLYYWASLCYESK